MYVLFIFLMLSQCSGRNKPLRIYGGEDADKETYPYVVRLEMRYTIKLDNDSLFDRQGHICTASALSSTWSVTAAHCLTDLDYQIPGTEYVKLVVRYGSVHNLLTDKNAFTDVVLLIPHPTFTFRKTSTGLVIKHDIGLIKTNTMPLKRFIKLSPVDYNTLYGHEVVFGGYGITTIKVKYKVSDNETITGATLTLKKTLQIFNVTINRCFGDLGLGPFLCLGHHCGSVAVVCAGDSGGPVIHSSGIVAVLSIGQSNKNCGDPTDRTLISVAGITSPVGPYFEWIYSHVRS